MKKSLLVLVLALALIFALGITASADGGATQLDTPTNPAWDSGTPGKATWTAVEHASSYTVQLFKGGTASGDAVTGVTGTEKDFTSAIVAAGTGNYTFKVTAIGDGTNYSDSEQSGASAEYVYNSPIKLSAPTGLAWDGTVKGKATWGAVTNASSYTVQLYKGTETLGAAVSVAAGTLVYDFTTTITAAGTGSYTFTVTAIGNGTTHSDSDASSASAAYSYTAPIKLATPTGLAWDTTVKGKATWGAVTNASSYSVQLYKGGIAQGTAVSVAAGTLVYDFTTAITAAGTGSYTFKVTAVGDGTTYGNSDQSVASAVYNYTAPIALSGNVYQSNKTTASKVSFSFAAKDYDEQLDLPSNWDVEIDYTDVYIGFNQTTIDTVQYSTSSSKNFSNATYKSATDLYEIPIENETMYVNVKLKGSNDIYQLRLDSDSAIITVKVYDSDKKNPESATFTSKTKTVNVDEDWDKGDVYLKFGSSSVDKVKYGYSSSGSKTSVTEDKNDYYKIPLKGTTYVEFRYSSTTYTLTIKPDGSTDSDMLINSVAATSKDKGKGTDFLAFFDNSGKIHIFVPYKGGSDIYLNIKSDHKVYYEDSSKDQEGDWVDLDGIDTVTIDDVDFDIVIHNGKSKNASDDDLSALSVKAGTKKNSLSNVTLSPAFASGTKSYNAFIGSSNTYAQITAKLADKNAYMIINGYALHNTSSAKSWDLSGLSTKTNSFKYTVYVIAEDCETYSTYTVNLIRGGDTALKSLSVGGYTLTPAFSPDKNTYTVAVPSNVSSLNISAATESTDVAIAITGGGGSATGTKGSASGNFNLQEGINNFTIVASSGGSSASYYYVSVFRQPAVPVIQVSNQNININGVAKTLSAYNINGNNFVMLRDLAALLKGSGKQFAVDFSSADQRVDLTMGGSYTLRGDEGGILPAYKKQQVSGQTIYLGGNRIYPMAYNIDGSNFVMIRDLASVMDFGVTYTAASRTININTSTGYTPGY